MTEDEVRGVLQGLVHDITGCPGCEVCTGNIEETVALLTIDNHLGDEHD